MDAGTSAVLAGGIAGLVSLGGTLVTYRQTKRQMISDAKLQLREPRKRAYNDFLVACREAQEAIWELADAETHETAPGRLASALQDRRPLLRSALGGVYLEGPQEVSAAAITVLEEFAKLHADAHEAFEEDLECFEGGFTQEIGEALDDYVTAAQKALSTFAD